MPEYAARRFAAALNLATTPPPVELAPIELAMAWHARADGDPAQAWFRDAVVAASAQL